MVEGYMKIEEVICVVLLGTHLGTQLGASWLMDS